MFPMDSIWHERVHRLKASSSIVGTPSAACVRRVSLEFCHDVVW